MKRPCSDCPEQTQIGFQNFGIPHFPFLDSAEQNLLYAQAYEVNDSNKENVRSLIEIIQAIRGREQPNLSRPWGLLRVEADKLTKLIPCQYCKMHTHYDLVQSIDVAQLFENGKILEAFRLEIVKDVKKWKWMLLAGYYRLVIPFVRRLLGTRTPPHPH